jgi:hypothetical protein
VSRRDLVDAVRVDRDERELRDGDAGPATVARVGDRRAAELDETPRLAWSGRADDPVRAGLPDDEHERRVGPVPFVVRLDQQRRPLVSRIAAAGADLEPADVARPSSAGRPVSARPFRDGELAADARELELDRDVDAAAVGMDAAASSDVIRPSPAGLGRGEQELPRLELGRSCRPRRSADEPPDEVEQESDVGRVDVDARVEVALNLLDPPVDLDVLVGTEAR